MSPSKEKKSFPLFSIHDEPAADGLGISEEPTPSSGMIGSAEPTPPPGFLGGMQKPKDPNQVSWSKAHGDDESASTDDKKQLAPTIGPSDPTPPAVFTREESKAETVADAARAPPGLEDIAPPPGLDDAGNRMISAALLLQLRPKPSEKPPELQKTTTVERAAQDDALWARFLVMHKKLSKKARSLTPAVNRRLSPLRRDASPWGGAPLGPSWNAGQTGTKKTEPRRSSLPPRAEAPSFTSNFMHLRPPPALPPLLPLGEVPLEDPSEWLALPGEWRAVATVGEKKILLQPNAPLFIPAVADRSASPGAKVLAMAKEAAMISRGREAEPRLRPDAPAFVPGKRSVSPATNHQRTPLGTKAAPFKPAASWGGNNVFYPSFMSDSGFDAPLPTRGRDPTTRTPLKAPTTSTNLPQQASSRRAAASRSRSPGKKDRGPMFEPEEEAAPDGKKEKTGRGYRQRNLGRKYGGNDTASPDVTSLMLRGLPCSCADALILKEIDEKGFKGQYDFFYMPRDRRQPAKNNLGYAFINFLVPEDATRFRETFEGHQFAQGSSSSTKKATITRASMQGTNNAWTHFKRSAILHSRRRPKFYPNGEVIEGEEEIAGPPHPLREEEKQVLEQTYGSGKTTMTPQAAELQNSTPIAAS